MNKKTNIIDDKLNKIQDLLSRNHAFAYQEEHWFTSDLDNVCPMCSELEKVGWVPSGILPPYRKAHSILGEGKWNAPDSSCNCRKGYRRAKGDRPDFEIGELVYNPSSQTYTVFKEAQTKVQLILNKYKTCTCASSARSQEKI